MRELPLASSVLEAGQGDLKIILNTPREAGANFWLPWLALYTGARLEELAGCGKSA
jgi:hypothetical protein